MRVLRNVVVYTLLASLTVTGPAAAPLAKSTGLGSGARSVATNRKRVPVTTSHEVIYLTDAQMQAVTGGQGEPQEAPEPGVQNFFDWVSDALYWAYLQAAVAGGIFGLAMYELWIADGLAYAGIAFEGLIAAEAFLLSELTYYKIMLPLKLDVYTTLLTIPDSNVAWFQIDLVQFWYGFEDFCGDVNCACDDSSDCNEDLVCRGDEPYRPEDPDSPGKCKDWLEGGGNQMTGPLVTAEM